MGLLKKEKRFKKTFPRVCTGEELRQIRKEAGLSLDALALLSGIAKPNLSALENNRRGVTQGIMDKVTQGIERGVSHA